MSAAVLAAANSDWMLYVGAAALFVAIFVAVAAVTLPGVRRRRLAKELAAETEAPSSRSQLSNIGAKAADFAERGLARHDRAGALATSLERAGIDVRPAEYVVMVLSAALGAALVGLLLGGPLASLIAAGITIGAFAAAVSLKTSKRCKAFDEQLPDALSLIAGALRAGHSLPQAIDALAQEAESPTAEEFRRALFETQLGHTLPTALRAMAERVRSEDFTWVVQAIEIQGDVGGDLAGVLDNVTNTIRDRTRVRRQIDTLTAEGRLSAIILLALPIMMFAFMVVANPTYIAELTGSFAGICLLVIGATLMVGGAFWLRRITRLAFEEDTVSFQLIISAVAVVAGVGVCIWAFRGAGGEVTAKDRKLVRANLGPSVATSDMRDVVLAQPAWDRIAVPVIRKSAEIARKLTPAGWLDALEQRRNYAGLGSTWTLERLLAVKSVLGLAGAALGLLVFLPDPTGMTFCAALLFTFVGFYLTDIVMNSKARERHTAIERAFPNTVDQITICVEAGLGLDAAIAHAARSGNGPLAEELERVLQDVQAGLSRQAALDALAERTDVKDIRHFVMAIGQANRYGVPIADALRVQATEGRDRRRARAEERAQQMSVKLLFPLIFCIFPALLVVLLGPAAIRISGMSLS